MNINAKQPMTIEMVKHLIMPFKDKNHEIRISLYKTVMGTYTVIYKKFQKKQILDYDKFDCISILKNGALKEFAKKVEILKKNGYINPEERKD